MIWEDDNYIAFENIKPEAPVHVLIIPKDHVEKKDAIKGAVDVRFWDNFMSAINKVIKQLDLDKTGYRLVNNGAGYNHLEHEHFHLLGGEGWHPDK